MRAKGVGVRPDGAWVYVAIIDAAPAPSAPALARARSGHRVVAAIPVAEAARGTDHRVGGAR